MTMDADTTPTTADNRASALDPAQDSYRSTYAFLTPAMQAFAEHWAHSRNQVKAYLHAYPGATVNYARSAARHLFRDHRVQAEIRRVLERWTDLSAVKLERIEHELARVAFADARTLYDAKGNLLRPDQWDADAAAAVASYSETPTRYGLVRKVRLHDKHASARTLAEMKGAFEKQKAPPGIQASFTINLGAGPVTLGAPPDGRTITVDVPPIAEAQSKLPKKVSKSQHLPPPKVKKARSGRKTVEVLTVRQESVTQITEQAHAVAVSTPISKPELF